VDKYKLFLVAALAAVVMLASASGASASGNRFGTLKIPTAAQDGTYDPKPVHYRHRYRRSRKYRRRHNYRRRHYSRRYNRRRHYRRHHRRRYYGPAVYFRVPGFGFHFGY
jgi:hypothetical protein